MFGQVVYKLIVNLACRGDNVKGLNKIFVGFFVPFLWSKGRNEKVHFILLI